MAKKKVVVTFHHIDKCGHYSWAGKNSVLGGLDQTLADLKKWSDGKPISLTKLTNIKQTKDQMPVYLVGVDKIGDDWTLATWNEVPAGEGGVASVAMNSVVGGEPRVFANDVVDNSIPGYATYFWIVPEHNALATLRMESSVAGKESMRLYVEAFLSRESSFAVEGDDGKIIGYRSPEDDDDQIQKLHPKFRISVYAKKGALEEIRENSDRIVKVIRAGKLTTENEVDRAAYQGALSFLRGANSKRKIISESRLRLELEMTPTKAELDRMIREELSSEHSSSWEDLGFALKGETNAIRWVTKSLARDTFEMDLDVNKAGVVIIKSLKKELAARRTHLLRLLS